MKATLIALGILLVIGGILGYIFYNQKQTDEAWNSKCRTSGGIIKESGKVCDYVNCDHSKYSCNMYS